MLTAAFLLALVGVASFAGGLGIRSSLQSQPSNPPAKNTSGYYQNPEGYWERTADPLVIITLGLVVVTLIMVCAVRSQVNLARDEFNATHRPKLVVREVSIFWVRTAAEVSFVLINEGETTAHNICCEFYIKDIIMIEHGRSKHKIDFTDNPIPNVLHPGTFTKHKGTVTVDIPQFLTSAEAEPRIRCALSFEGFASYTRSNNLKRRSAYYRPWNIHTLSFMPSDDPDKEYPG
jgi:hypothetical protein